MHPILHDLPSLRRAHAHFADWERAKHRAQFFAKVGFPDSHPLRHAVDQVGRDLEEHRWAADLTIAEVARKHGDFRAHVNGFFFEDATDWFQSGKDIYWDCPDIVFGRGVKRNSELYLAGVASLHDLETSGRGFIEAVGALVERARPESKRNLVRTAKVFDKDCQRLERQLKRVKVCPRDRWDALLCLQRKGLPSALGKSVLEFLM